MVPRRASIKELRSITRSRSGSDSEGSVIYEVPGAAHMDARFFCYRRERKSSRDGPDRSAAISPQRISVPQVGRVGSCSFYRLPFTERSPNHLVQHKKCFHGDRSCVYTITISVMHCVFLNLNILDLYIKSLYHGFIIVKV